MVSWLRFGWGGLGFWRFEVEGVGFGSNSFKFRALLGLHATDTMCEEEKALGLRDRGLRVCSFWLESLDLVLRAQGWG